MSYLDLYHPDIRPTMERISNLVTRINGVGHMDVNAMRGEITNFVESRPDLLGIAFHTPSKKFKIKRYRGLERGPLVGEPQRKSKMWKGSLISEQTGVILTLDYGYSLRRLKTLMKFRRQQNTLFVDTWTQGRKNAG